MSKKRLYSLDMMKFMAALMITNSHFQPLYEGVNACSSARLCVLWV